METFPFIQIIFVKKTNFGGGVNETTKDKIKPCKPSKEGEKSAQGCWQPFSFPILGQSWVCTQHPGSSDHHPGHQHLGLIPVPAAELPLVGQQDRDLPVTREGTEPGLLLPELRGEQGSHPQSLGEKPVLCQRTSKILPVVPAVKLSGCCWVLSPQQEDWGDFWLSSPPTFRFSASAGVFAPSAFPVKSEICSKKKGERCE